MLTQNLNLKSHSLFFKTKSNPKSNHNLNKDWVSNPYSLEETKSILDREQKWEYDLVHDGFYSARILITIANGYAWIMELEQVFEIFDINGQILSLASFRRGRLQKTNQGNGGIMTASST
ncbi:hypothetical protein PanWU01x14_111390 [Parasponia andersonii]|uniref:Uncharacterized protein n=1 Tax=Parasponia andersonii TaxID=3476 RepID=A0A2P5CZ01_PARAD|nr:hypothetical protein PanWU01x14_111390 [Parasponia andersonii]